MSFWSSLNKKILLLSFLLFIGCAITYGQDLLARQVPVENKMQAIDSLALLHYIIQEEELYPSYRLYQEDWNNDHVHVYGALTVPDTFRIDLRGFTMPTTNQRITSNFGYRRRFRRMHKGVDIKVYIGDTIRSAFDGKVRIVDYERRGYGKYVVIRHDNGLETIYGHLSKHLVIENQNVKSGEPIGLGGNTGRSTGSHLHFETRLLGQEINPVLMFDFPNQDVTGESYVYYSPRAKKKSFVRSVESDEEALYHKVRSGDTLSKIARRHGTTISQLCKLNKITTRTILRPGQLLRYT